MNTGETIVAKVLALLRKWGWETGLEKLKNEIRATRDEAERSTLKLFAAWMAGERGKHQEALEELRDLEQWPVLIGWAKTGAAYVALREHDYHAAHDLLDHATQSSDSDVILKASISHCRGALYYHEGNDEPALSQLRDALALFGRQHFGTGRVLDTLGMVYTARNNFHAAREFFEHSIESKKSFGDSAGLAVSHGQLGRLYLDWGHLRKAEEHFKEDLELSRRIGDERGEAQMYNYLGQLAMIRKKWDDAAAWLDQSIQLSERGGWRVLEGFARKDRALTHFAEEEIEEAEAQIEMGEEKFRAVGFEEGLAHMNRARGVLLRTQKNYDQAERVLRAALAHFDQHKEYAEVARTQLEQARILHARGVPRPLVTEALCSALDRAEQCRRDTLVRDIEAELCEVDEAAYYSHIYRRSRGRDVSAETVSLLTGERESATVLFLDVQGSTEFARVSDPEVVMMTLNQMMGEFETVLDRHRASITAYLGDGFMALLRGTDHPRRGVLAALGLVSALKEFNSPRKVLGLTPLNVRIGISSGEVFIGNVGTYHKMDFTAIGTTANLAARLQSEAEPGMPCVSRATYEQVKDKFTFRSDKPRIVALKGLGEQDAWDVVEQGIT